MNGLLRQKKYSKESIPPFPFFPLDWEKYPPGGFLSPKYFLGSRWGSAPT